MGDPESSRTSTVRWTGVSGSIVPRLFDAQLGGKRFRSLKHTPASCLQRLPETSQRMVTQMVQFDEAVTSHDLDFCQHILFAWFSEYHYLFRSSVPAEKEKRDEFVSLGGHVLLFRVLFCEFERNTDNDPYKETKIEAVHRAGANVLSELSWDNPRFCKLLAADQSFLTQCFLLMKNEAVFDYAISLARQVIKKREKVFDLREIKDIASLVQRFCDRQFLLFTYILAKVVVWPKAVRTIEIATNPARRTNEAKHVIAVSVSNYNVVSSVPELHLALAKLHGYNRGVALIKLQEMDPDKLKVEDFEPDDSETDDSETDDSELDEQEIFEKSMRARARYNGLLFKVVTVFRKEPEDSSFWPRLSSYVWQVVTDPKVDKMAVDQTGLLDHLFAQVLRGNPEMKDFLQTNFDLLGELIKLDKHLFNKLGEHLNEDYVAEDFFQALFSDIEGANRFIQCVVLSLNHLYLFSVFNYHPHYSTDLDDGWQTFEFFIINDQYRIMRDLMEVGLGEQGNERFMDTVILIFIYMERCGVPLHVNLQQFMTDPCWEPGLGDESLVLFRDCLRLDRAAGKDSEPRRELQKMMGISLADWSRVVSFFCDH